MGNREESIKIYVTKAEKTRIEKEAESQGLQPATWARSQLLRQLNTPEVK